MADANSNRNRFAQQLNQSRNLPQTFTGQPATSNAIQTLNNRLTVEMLKAPSAWQLDSLEAATRQYMSTAGYADQQDGMQFLEKLANCRQVAAGYGNTGGAINGGSASKSNFGSGTPAFNVGQMQTWV